MTLVPGDPLAHRALDSLLRAEASVRRRLSADLEREGLSATGFSVLVILTTAGGELELRVLRARLRTSKANATEVVTTLESRGLVLRRRLASDRRAAVAGQAAAQHQAAALERGDDLGRVGLGGAQPGAQHAQLELAARGGQDHQHREAGCREPLALEVGAQPAADRRLGAQQRIEGAMRERVTGHEGHPGAGP